jgi:alpha-beta hydrolase superfamily lysophospholipase
LCAQDLTDILSALFDWLTEKQQQTINNPAKACKAKVSLISHSMGTYVVQKAMQRRGHARISHYSSVSSTNC